MSASDNSLSRWDEARRIAGQLRLEAHLARMNLRDRWHVLEAAIARTGDRASKAITAELRALRALFETEKKSS